jgi:hypothetical protein
MLSLSITGYSQSVDQLLKKVSKIENTEKVKIGGFMMNFASMSGGLGDMPFVKGIKGIEVYDLSSCSLEDKQDIGKQINKIKDTNGYETMIHTKEKKSGVRIMIKKEKDIIKEILLLCMENEEPSIIRLTGKIKESDLNDLVNEHNN